MKKLFNVSIGGYYLCSMVLGTLLFVIMLLLPHDMNYWFYYHSKGTFERAMVANRIEKFLPSVYLYNWLFIDGDSYSSMVVALCSIMAVMIAVAMIDGRGTSKVWRTKILQSVGCVGLLICIEMAFQYAIAHMYDQMSPLMLFVPVVLMIVPLLILKKTRQLKPTQGLDLIVEPVKRPAESEK